MYNTLDDLIDGLKKTYPDDEVQKFCDHLHAWKDNDDNVDRLVEMAEHFLGNVWIKNDDTHNQVYAIWSEFYKNNISWISGMTMNERLFIFNFFERWDQADEAGRLKLSAKLMAA